MLKKKFCFCLLTVFVALQSYGQGITIKSTDATSYPVIRSTVQVNSTIPVQKSDFKVLEERKELEFTLDQLPATEDTIKGKAIFILIEASGFTYGRASQNFKKAINEALDQVGRDDKVNVGYFGRANRDSRALHILNAEFTSKASSLKPEVTKIVAPKDTNYVADVYKAIYEALDFMAAKQGLPNRKMLIVVSAAINNSRSPIKAEDCIEKSKRLNIPIYSVTYKTGNRYAPDNFLRLSDRTNGKTATADNQEEIRKATVNFINSASSIPVKAASGEYVLEFTTANPKNGRMYQYEVRFKDEKRAATYTTPAEESSFFEEYGLISILLAVLIGGGIFWALNKARTKKAEFEMNKQAEQEALLRANEQKEKRAENLQRQQPVAVRDNHIAPIQNVPKRDLKKTMIMGSENVPVLTVVAENFSQNYSLDRPQLTIGRAAGNDIVIPEQTVSGKHAAITNENGVFFVTDLGSTNGTFINTTRISGKQMLKPGDAIRMGAAQLKIQV